MPEDKYVPNSAVMGGSSVARKVTFFGRDKLGAEKKGETPRPAESGSPNPERPGPDSPILDNSPTEITSVPATLENATEAGGSSAPVSPGGGLPGPGRPRPADGVHPGRPGPVSPGPDRQSINLWSSLPQVDGHLRLPNIIIDHLYQLLDLQERSVYEQLYRLSHGYGKSTCRIGYPQLAVRSGMGRTATIQTVERLVKKGLISRIGTDLGGKKEQGSEYWVSAPGSSAPDSSGPGSPGDEPNKIKALKEKIKKSGASHQRKDYSDCPDCQGTGMWYPEGYGKGVARCKHERLR